MPPQNTQPPPAPAPGQFDFMMKDQPKPPGRVGSLLSGIPKPAKIILVAVVGLFLLVILYSLFFGGKTTNADQLVGVAARAQEIARVSTLVQQQSANTDTKALASTTSASLSSQQKQLVIYLKSQGIKTDTKKLASRLDKNTDAQLLAAQQNNNYDQTYFNYLKTNLAAYQNNINTVQKGVGKKAQTILSTANTSVQTLLSAPQLKWIQG